MAVVALTNANAQSTIVDVRINNGTLGSPNLWTDTGISVTNGQVITINADGTWTFNLSDTNGPDGIDFGSSSDLFLSNNVMAGLVAYIGSDPYQGQWHTTFFPQMVGYQQIGSSCQFIATTNGELWLGYNDDARFGPVTDNAGVVKAQIFLNYGATNDFGCVDTVLDDGLFLGSFPATKFRFRAVGATNAVLAIYGTSDLTNWVFLDKLTLNNLGRAAFTNVTSVPYRFYKAVNGICASQPYGFVRIPLAAGQIKLIADQLIAPDNTLNGLAPTMNDGSPLAAGIVVAHWNGSAYTYRTWNGSSWAPNGTATLNPGEGAQILNTNANATATMISFIGTVPPAPQQNLIIGGHTNYLYSSVVPMGGKITSWLNYPPTPGDVVQIFRGGFTTYGFDDLDLDWVPSEPIVNVGESFFLNTSTNKTWTQDALFRICQ